MKKICSFRVNSKPVAWRVEQNTRFTLSQATRRLMSEIRSVSKKKFPRKRKGNNRKEIELVIDLFGKYDKEFKDEQGNRIPDLDHVATLVMNALSKILYEDDVQVSSLLINRWNEKEKEQILITAYEIQGAENG